MTTRNVTLSLPDDLVRRAKVLAAERDSSVSAIVAQLLETAVGEGTTHEQLWSEEEDVMRSGLLHVGEVTWTRDDLHTR